MKTHNQNHGKFKEKNNVAALSNIVHVGIT